MLLDLGVPLTNREMAEVLGVGSISKERDGSSPRPGFTLHRLDTTPPCSGPWSAGHRLSAHHRCINDELGEQPSRGLKIPLLLGTALVGFQASLPHSSGGRCKLCRES